MRAGVEPGVAATHGFDTELALFEVEAVEVGNFQFAARRGFHRLGEFDDPTVVEVEAGDGIA